MLEVLLPREMAEADRLAAQEMPGGSYRLMLNAGAVVTDALLSRFPEAQGYDVLCGPGNNGGDGYVVVRMLKEHGLSASLWRRDPPRPGSDAARAAEECPITPQPLDAFQPKADRPVVDALFGAGLSRPLTGVYAEALERVRRGRVPVMAVDLPSGVSGESGAVLGTAPAANLTVTFFRKKPGHLLYPGCGLCGDIIIGDIGIASRVLDLIEPRCRENARSLWQESFPELQPEIHKYQRGHVAVMSGPPTMTGAARLAARGAARIGAGAVTMLSPGASLAVNAMHLTSTMLRRVEDETELTSFLQARRPAAVVLGPGFGVADKARDFAELVMRLASDDDTRPPGLVLDADGITAFAEVPEQLFTAAEAAQSALILTPHMGEFARLFPDLTADKALSKLEATRQAATRAHAVVLLKGADTIIAAPDGTVAINSNGTPFLATAGSGDVLAGMIAGLLAQKMPAFAAACAAAYLHGEAGRRMGHGLIAEDLPEILPDILRSHLS